MFNNCAYLDVLPRSFTIYMRCWLECETQIKGYGILTKQFHNNTFKVDTRVNLQCKNAFCSMRIEIQQGWHVE